MRRVAVTRPRENRDPFAAELRRRGIEPVALPLLEITLLRRDELDAVALRLREAGRFDFVAVTSRHGARGLAALRRRLECGGERFSPPVAAVGAATAATLGELGFRVDLVAPDGTARSLLEVLAAVRRLEGVRVLLAVGDRARRVLPDGLRERGADVVEAVVYRTRAAPKADLERFERVALEGRVEAVALASGSAVAALVEGLGAQRARAALAARPCVVLGETPTQALVDLGLEPAARAARPTLADLADAASALLSPQPRRSW